MRIKTGIDPRQALRKSRRFVDFIPLPLGCTLIAGSGE
jgi:hypothetical protein